MNRDKNYSGQQYSENTVSSILDFIYNSVDLSQFRYKIAEYETDFTVITRERHMVSANFSGTSCLLIFLKLREKFYSVLVERKTLSYNRNQLKPESVKIIPVNVRLSGSVYNGTIFDGTYILDKKTRSKIFVITDVYRFNGRDTCPDDIRHKLANIRSYLESNMENDTNINNIKLNVNKLYDPTNIRDLMADMDKSKNLEFKGFVFYPVKSGTKIIYLNNNDRMPPSKKDNVDNRILPHNTDNTQSFNKKNHELNTDMNTNAGTHTKKKKYVYICKTNDPVYCILEVRKTLSPDVYNIYCVEELQGYMKLKKLGIASIPDKQSSLMCKNILNSKINGKALMKCKFDSEKNKWIPIEESKERKYPNYISEIEEKLDILIESDSDHDE